MRTLRVACLGIALLTLDSAGRADPAPAKKPAPPPVAPVVKAKAVPVPERCLLGLKPKQIREVYSVALSPTETAVLIDQPKKASTLGICAADGALQSPINLPRIDPYQDSCTILGKCDSAPSDLDEKLRPGESVLMPRFFEVVPGEWTFSVERSASVDTGSEESGPGEEISYSTLYVFRLTVGKLARILMIPLKASRSDAELNDNFETKITPESVGVLSVERTIHNGVYPDDTKERIRQSHLRWNGKRLVSGK